MRIHVLFFCSHGGLCSTRTNRRTISMGDRSLTPGVSVLPNLKEMLQLLNHILSLQSPIYCKWIYLKWGVVKWNNPKLGYLTFKLCVSGLNIEHCQQLKGVWMEPDSMEDVEDEMKKNQLWKHRKNLCTLLWFQLILDTNMDCSTKLV